MTTTPNTPPDPAQPPAQNGSRITAWIKRHTRGVVIGAVMGLGVMAIAGGGLGGYVAYIKQKAPPVVQDTAIPAAETIASVAETTARVVVGGPGGGEGSPVAAAGLSVLPPGDGSMPTAPESGTTSVSIEIVSKRCHYSTVPPYNREVFHNGSYWMLEDNGDGCGFNIKAAMNADQTAEQVFYFKTDGHGSSPATFDVEYETGISRDTTFTIPAGSRKSEERAVKVITRCDQSENEGNEMLYMKLSNSDGSLETAPILVTLVDNCIKPGSTQSNVQPPDLPTIGFNPTMYTRTEGIDPYATLTVDRTPGDATDTAIGFTVTAREINEDFLCHRSSDDSVATSGEDFAAGAYSGTIAAGATSATVSIPIIDGKVGEAPEWFCAELEVADPGKAATRRSGLADDSLALALISLNDNDTIYPTYQNSYLKLGEPGWNHRTEELAIHFPTGNDKYTKMECSSENGNIAPFEFTVPASDTPQTFRHTVSPVKDADFLYEWDKLTCGLKHSPTMVDTKYLKDGIPVWIQDSDVPNGMPRHDSDDNAIYNFMVVGDMGCAGTPLYPRIILNRPAPAGGVTFNIVGSTALGLPSTATIPEGAHDISFPAYPSATINLSTPWYVQATPQVTPVDHSKWKLVAGHNPPGEAKAQLHILAQPCDNVAYIPKPMPVVDVPTRPANAALELSWADGTRDIDSEGAIHVVEGAVKTEVKIAARLNHDAVFDEYFELKDRAVVATSDDYELSMSGRVFVPKGERNATAIFYVKAKTDDSDEPPEAFKIRLENDGMKSNELIIKIFQPDDAPAPTPTPTPTPEPPDGPNDPPGPPAYVGLYGSATDREVIATWPEPTTGGDVQVYIVCINKVGSDVMNCVSTADRMHTFENLELGSYWVTVKAKNTGGESAPAREGITLAQP